MSARIPHSYGPGKELGPYFIDMNEYIQHTAISFNNLHIATRFIDRIHELEYVTPTPIQGAAIPLAINGKDLLGIAQTGTGKTLAFALPMMQRISERKGQGVVLLPTRELALQVDDTFKKIGKPFGLRTAVLIGGAPIEAQMRLLKNNPHVIIGTPGRIIDHLERKSLTLNAVTVLVLDEADLMLDMGFIPQVNRILKDMPVQRQTMLFSATMPQEIEKIVSSYMKAPVRIEASRAGSAPKQIKQEVCVIEKERKTDCLDSLLKNNEGSAIVFVRTKHSAKKIFFQLKDRGYSAAEIHSNRSLAQRRAALDGFRAGRNRILVATDIAARGIDVPRVALVVNYDLPENPEDYIHRIGRTGRAGEIGYAVSFATKKQFPLLKRIERLNGYSIQNIQIKTQEYTGATQQEQNRVFPKKRTNYSQNYGFRKRNRNRNRIKTPNHCGWGRGVK
jgi:ATP-dependent RNA helicase RhlE